MKCSKNAVRLFATIVSLMLLLVIIGCGDDGGPSGPKLPADPGPGNLAGLIVGTINERALAGVTVSVGSITTTTDSDGIFRLDGVGEGILGVMIEGGDIYARRAAVDTAAGRSVLLDAIEVDSGFNLGFYRELARGNHPEEEDMYQTHRWVSSTPPTVYIDTNALGTLDGVIEQSTINTVRDVVRDVIPVFTGKYYSSVTVETGNFLDWESWDDIPNNSVVFTFDDSIYFDPGAVGITLTEPDFVSPSTSTINKTVIFVIDSSIFYGLEGLDLDTVIAHETGHGFGFRHTSLLPSIMWRRPENGSRYTDADRLHMAIMYKRVAGNTDIDNDPVPGAKMRGEAPGVQVHIDERTGEPKLSPEMSERLQTLRRHPLLKQYLNN